MECLLQHYCSCLNTIYGGVRGAYMVTVTHGYGSAGNTFTCTPVSLIYDVIMQ